MSLDIGKAEKKVSHAKQRVRPNLISLPSLCDARPQVVGSIYGSAWQALGEITSGVCAVKLGKEMWQASVCDGKLYLSRTTASDDGKERQKEMSDTIVNQIAHRKQEHMALGKDVAAAMLRVEEVPFLPAIVIACPPTPSTLTSQLIRVMIQMKLQLSWPAF
jgi:hypothetical protein